MPIQQLETLAPPTTEKQLAPKSSTIPTWITYTVSAFGRGDSGGNAAGDRSMVIKRSQEKAVVL
jgi:hypothetical protein